MYFVSGVLLGEDVTLFPTCYMGVDLRRHNGAVPKQLLDIPNINAFFQQQRCERMAEHVRRDMIFYAGQLAVLIDNGSN